MKQELDNRLLAVAREVRKGAYLADVGTDHAYLPIHLMSRGLIENALASDIRKGPLSRAEEHIEASGLSGRIATLLTDGLHGVENYPVTDIVIAGMGGQMIASILEEASFVREKMPRLILQPMQNVPELRRYLAGGYRILRETQATEGEKYYQILTAVYDGKPYSLSPAEEILGTYNIEHRKDDPEGFSVLCRRQLAVLQEKIEGLTKGNRDATPEKALQSELLALLSDL